MTVKFLQETLENFLYILEQTFLEIEKQTWEILNRDFLSQDLNPRICKRKERYI